MAFRHLSNELTSTRTCLTCHFELISIYFCYNTVHGVWSSWIEWMNLMQSILWQWFPKTFSNLYQSPSTLWREIMRRSSTANAKLQ